MNRKQNRTAINSSEIKKEETRPSFSSPLIEQYFPIQVLNELAELETQSGPARKAFRPIFSLHKWWARRLGTVFRTILLYSLIDSNTIILDSETDLSDSVTTTPTEHNSLDNFLNLSSPENFRSFFTKRLLFNQSDGKTPKIILDPFMGGGTTLIEALKYNLRIIGNDLNPLAWFITKKEIEPCSIDQLQIAFDSLTNQISPKIKEYFTTTCPECHAPSDIMYVFWVKTIPCPECHARFALLRSHIIARPRRNGTPGISLCPKCHQLNTFKTLTEAINCSQCNYQYYPLNEKTFEYGSFKCPSCSFTGNLVKTFQRLAIDIPPDSSDQSDPFRMALFPPTSPFQEEMYAIEYYCPSCQAHGYKSPDSNDMDLWTNIADQCQRNIDKIRIPHQKIPVGQKTQEILNFGYRYFAQLFTPRQLICLDLLYRTICTIDDQNIREIFLLTFSSALEYNNKLCMYQDHTYQIENAFSRHAYYMKFAYVENNLWGSHLGTGTFRNRFKVTLEAKRYNQRAFELIPATWVKPSKSGPSITKVFCAENQTISGNFVPDFSAINSSGDALLLSQDARSLPLPEASVDAIITDPPYYDNVQYSELADFFYIWLQLELSFRYPFFQSELTPKEGEMVVNSIRHQTHTTYLQIMTAIFQECARVIKPDGDLVFTFHHQNPKAWEALLNALLSAGWEFRAIYPIRAELRISKHILNKQNTKMDLVLVCHRKDFSQKSAENQSWEGLQPFISKEINSRFTLITPLSENLTEIDRYLVIMGIFLQFFSRHYPNLTLSNQLMTISQLVALVKTESVKMR